MSDKRCSISLIVNGSRWHAESVELAELEGLRRPWSLGGLQDYVRLIVGSQLLQLLFPL